jgi:tetratricopeptide (TPR) repeat protein
VTHRLVLAGSVAALVAVAVLLGGALRGGATSAAGAPPSVAADRLQSGFSTGDTPSLLRSLQSSLREHPEDAKTWSLLGLAYQQRARETGDPAYYSKSNGVLRRALALAPDDLLATSGLGSLALSRHRFGEALHLGRTALALSPSTARNYGVVGDALVELGRYRQAFRAFDTMARLRPGLSAYSRVSYARELLGDQSGAVAAMQLAVSAAVDAPEASAWTHVQLGKLYWARGRLGAASAEFRAALTYFPGYVYAYDALAQVEWARGRHARAVALEQRAVDTIPLPQFVGSLGDMLRLSGKPAAAQRQYATEDGIRRLLAANGVRTDLETALFDVDHGLRLRASLALARKAERARPSIDGEDVLAWALVRNGRCDEALHYSQRALRLGTRDATKYFHRGMIERCLGRTATAQAWFRRALGLNPHFSVLWSALARRNA